jgi:hypothetical protein
MKYKHTTVKSELYNTVINYAHLGGVVPCTGKNIPYLYIPRFH